MLEKCAELDNLCIGGVLATWSRQAWACSNAFVVASSCGNIRFAVCTPKMDEDGVIGFSIITATSPLGLVDIKSPQPWAHNLWWYRWRNGK